MLGYMFLYNKFYIKNLSGKLFLKILLYEIYKKIEKIYYNIFIIIYT